MTRGRISIFLCTSLFAAGLYASAPPAGATTIGFDATELLGTPTATSMTVNIIPSEAATIWFEYSTDPGFETDDPGVLETTPQAVAAGETHEVEITGLSADTEYFYRTRYISGDATEEARPDLAEQPFTFRTARSEGETFAFTVITDSHLGAGGSANYDRAVANIDSNTTSLFNPDNIDTDFHVDVGDTFINNGLTTQAALNTVYLRQRQMFGVFGHSIPSFVALGNHENEEGWNFDDTFEGNPGGIALASLKARKEFFPTPAGNTDSFYTGNADTNFFDDYGENLSAPDLHSGARDNLREDYYEFTWGDALVVVLDPFQYTLDNPYGACAGESADDPATGDQWNWTLGQAQYDWLQSTLEGSDAKFKFVFSHHVTGGQLAGNVGGCAPAGYVRGGRTAAPYFEWGGNNAAEQDVFSTMRPGMVMPVHDLMVANDVTAFFHGHDHQYAYEKVDGIVYLEVASPSIQGNGFNIYSETNPLNCGDDVGDVCSPEVLGGPGHVRVTVNPTTDVATAEYIGSGSGTNGDLLHNFTMQAAGDPGPDLTAPVISLVGADPQVVSAGDAYVELGATASDNVDGQIDPSNIVIDATAVDTSTPDDYDVTYNVEDAAGNDATEVVRTVTVVDDTAPELSLVGTSPVTIVAPGAYTELGATATDNVDDDTALTALIDIGGDTVLPDTMGSYVVTYNVADAAGNDAAEVTRTVNVVSAPDETKPVILLTGAATVDLTEGDTYTEQGATATDDVDGVIDPSNIDIAGAPTNPVTVGTYTVTYNVEDAAGNPADEVTRIVNVAPKPTVVPPPAPKKNRIHVTNVIQSGPAEYSFLFGTTDEQILVGDWNANGRDGFARRDGNTIVEVDERGNPIRTVTFGEPTDTLYRVGDWDCDGTDTLAVQRGNVFHITNSPTATGATTAIGYGKAGDEVFVGDWNRDRCDTFAVRRGNVFYVRNSVTTGVADIVFGYGRVGDEVLVGDWNQDIIDTFAVRRGNIIYIRNDFQTGIAETVIGYGKATDDLLVGDWNADRIDTFAVRRPETN